MVDQFMIQMLDVAGWQFRYLLFDHSGMLLVNFWMTARKAISSAISLVFLNSQAPVLCLVGVGCALIAISIELFLMWRAASTKRKVD